MPDQCCNCATFGQSSSGDFHGPVATIGDTRKELLMKNRFRLFGTWLGARCQRLLDLELSPMSSFRSLVRSLFSKPCLLYDFGFHALKLWWTSPFRNQKINLMFWTSRSVAISKRIAFRGALACSKLDKRSWNLLVKNFWFGRFFYYHTFSPKKRKTDKAFFCHSLPRTIFLSLT